MTKLQKNIKDPVTTKLGLALVIPALIVLLAPVFVEVKKDLTDVWYIPVGILVLGVLLVVSPDTIVRGANKGVDKYMGDKSDKHE